MNSGWFVLANLTLFDAKYKINASDEWLDSRWNLRRLANLSGGKEWQKEKSPNKIRTFGIGGRAVWTGGAREARIALPASRSSIFTIFDEQNGFSSQYSDYFRLDTRFYWKKSLTGRRNSTFALECQNLTNHQNFAYHYYDALTEKIETKYQLGLIPNLSWRLEF